MRDTKDQLLLARLQAGDESALRDLAEAYGSKIYQLAFRYLRNKEDAEEVMQRLRIRIWQQFDQYETDKPFDAWARAIAYYLVLAFRKEKSRQREFFAERILEAVSSQYEKHLERANERRDVLVGCLDKLEGHKRELVQTYYSSGKQSSDVIAESLSMTPNALLEQGAQLQAQGKQHSARSLYERAARQAPNRCEPQVAVAVGRFDKDNLNASFSRLGPLSRRFPTCQSVRYYLGLMLAWTGQRDPAIAQFKRTVALGPETELGQGAAQFLSNVQGGGGTG